MESSRSKRRRLMLSYVPRRPDLPAIFESLNDDTLTTVLEFVGNKSYVTYAGINKHCKEVYLNTPGLTKETFLYGYAPLAVIKERYPNKPFFEAQVALSKGVVFYNRRDVLALVIQRRDTTLLKRICYIAAEVGKIDILDEVWNIIYHEDYKGYVFYHVDCHAARGGKLNVLKWFNTKELRIDEGECALYAARHAQLHILQWLREMRGLEFNGELYDSAINGGNRLHVMKWLRNQACPWGERTFREAAIKDNLDILQWLHDEGCPWPQHNRVHECYLIPEVIDWCRVNGYGD
eukprot:CAMPEP_0178966772 /NCGR_PEP_ID=MMETSP0789-20121207/17121_1 /TAXON_ID=3005 /ORGANISM="Rhizosolenia setigera, Strain CCMP 1694" /LENGTH=291 /DNA_ID=CAMNT_0020652101 /DNA_START=67 /DNA_END=939 /DNA_ORIENTATION=+